jgi:hypothetical protein
MKKLAFVAALSFAVVTVVSAQMGGQDKSKRPSPPASAECKFTDGKTIKMDYSSPRLNDPKTHQPRKIFGTAEEKALVPYGNVWRAGANEATTFVTDANLSVGGKEVPAGTYTIFAIPKADAWTLIVSKKTKEWGEPYPGEKDDLVRVPMSAAKTPALVENFTIAFDQAGSKCTLRMEWENTRASVETNEK